MREISYAFALKLLSLERNSMVSDLAAYRQMLKTVFEQCSGLFVFLHINHR